MYLFSLKLSTYSSFREHYNFFPFFALCTWMHFYLKARQCVNKKFPVKDYDDDVITKIK